MKFFRVGFVVLAAILLVSAACAAESTRTATILDFEGNVTVRLPEGVSLPADFGMVLEQGSAITTSGDSFALVMIEGAETATVEISENSRVLLSELMINENDGSQSTLIDLAIGKLLIRADKVQSERSKFEVKTPTSVVGVRGTTFEVQVEGIE